MSATERRPTLSGGAGRWPETAVATTDRCKCRASGVQVRARRLRSPDPTTRSEPAVHTIDGPELDARLRRRSDLQLLRVCGDDEEHGAIEGSLILPADIDPTQLPDRARDTVVYGCGAACAFEASTTASPSAEGFDHVRRYPGGLAAWRTDGRAIHH